MIGETKNMTYNQIIGKFNQDNAKKAVMRCVFFVAHMFSFWREA